MVQWEKQEGAIVMKKMVTVLCACLFVLGSMAFSASLVSRNLITDTLGETLVEQADIKERISSAISEQLPQSGMLGEQVGTAVASILKSDEVSRQLDAYLQLFIDDLVQGESSSEELNETLRTSIREQIDQMQLPSQDLLTKEQLNAAVDAALDQLDVTQIYEQALIQVRGELSPSQMEMLRLLQWLQSDVLYYGSLCVMIVCAVLFFIRGVRKGLRMDGQCADQRSAQRRGSAALRLFATMQDTALVSAVIISSTQVLLYLSGGMFVRAADGMGRFIVFAQTGKRLIRTGVMKNGQLLHGEAAYILCDGGRPVRIGRCHLAPDGAHPFRSDDRAWRRAERPAACPPCPSVLRRCRWRAGPTSPADRSNDRRCADR